MAKIATTSYDANWYIPSSIKALLEAGNQKEVRKEYTRLRDIAQKRLKRLEKAGLTNIAIYQSNYKRFKKLKDIKSNSELASRLSDLARFIKDLRSTKKKLFEIRDKSLKTLHSHGYKFVNKENYYDFAKFMEEYRCKMLDMEYDSGDAADTFGITVKHELDPDKVQADFEFWLENIERAKQLRYSKKSAGDYEKIKKELLRREKVRNDS